MGTHKNHLLGSQITCNCHLFIWSSILQILFVLKICYTYSGTCYRWEMPEDSIPSCLLYFWTIVHYSVKELNIELLTTPNSTVLKQDAIEASLGSTVCHCTFLGTLDILILCMLGNFACFFVVRHFFFINDFGSRSGP